MAHARTLHGGQARSAARKCANRQSRMIELQTVAKELGGTVLDVLNLRFAEHKAKMATWPVEMPFALARIYATPRRWPDGRPYYSYWNIDSR
jgi:hypothetical protein